MNKQVLADASQIESLMGHRLGPYLSFNPVNSAQIWQWCSAMGDQNPAYQPGPRQQVPPAMMQMWTMRNIDDDYAPGSTAAAPYQVFDEMKRWGYPANVAVSYDLTFHRYLQLGEQVKHYTTVVNISELKTTGLGVGYFVTERVEYLTLEEEMFAEALITYFQYRASQSGNDDSRQTAAEPEKATKTPWPPAAAPTSQPRFATLNPAELEAGDPLPGLHIPITHKLIIGGALASQDFIPVHHNLPAAKAAGMPDIFMNILTTGGLLGRYLSDWAGSGSCLKQLQFNLLAPNCPGDTMVMGGELIELTPQGDHTEARVSFTGKNSLGYHTKGWAVLALPTKTSTT